MTLPTLAPSWTQILRRNFTDIELLAKFLELTDAQKLLLAPSRPFILNVPQRLAAKMAKSTLEDPLTRQFVPLMEEEQSSSGYRCDPLEEDRFRITPKLLHKYSGRVLLVCSSACAMHCRYCFRQNFPYAVTQAGFEAELAAIAKDVSIKEVILSGGDPLSLSDRSLGHLLDGLSMIPHVKRIRFHTCFPIGIPERIDDAFCALIARIPQKIWFVIHANHPAEFDETVFRHIDLLRQCGVNILHQAVLLRGVNDDLKTLQTLYELLVDNGVIPYYLHQLDRVSGAAHFEVPVDEGRALMDALTAKLSGYALPRYVHEVAGAPSKMGLFPCKEHL